MSDTRECPFCAEVIKAKAVKCKHCGSVLTEEALARFYEEIARIGGKERPQPSEGFEPPPTVPATPESIVRLATILFADVSGFTKMSASKEPEEMREIMNALFSDLAGSIERFGGKIDKYIGDCVMAVWGIEGYREEDALRATNAAMSMLHRTRLRAERLMLPLAMHVGVNSGRVVFGTLGSGSGAAPTVLGDAVNLASRLCSKAPNGHVYASEETLKRLGDRFKGEPVELELKGLGLVRAYDIQPGRGQSHVTKHVVADFIGREDEIGRISKVLGAFQHEQSPSGALVIGHGGTGKSRLCDHVLRRHAADFKPLFGQAVPTETPVFGVLITGWLRDLLGGTDTAAIDRYLSDRPELLPYRDAIRLVLTTTEDLGQKPSRQIQRLDVELARFFAAASRKTPMVLVGTDMQWADPFSVDFCLALSDPSEAVVARLVILLDGRPGDNVERIKKQRRFDTIELNALTHDGIERFLESILEDMPPVHWIKSLRDRTGGVILHLSQVLNALAEEGVLEKNPQSGKWRLVKISEDLPVPQTLGDLTWLRIEHLPTWPREVLLHSGVCGVRFPRVMIHYAMNRPESDLAPPLNSLHSDGFLFVVPEVVAFEHGSIRETARRMLLKNERRTIAERILQCLGDSVWSDVYRPLAPDLFRDAQRELDLRRFLSNEAYRLIRAFRLQEARQILEQVGRDPWSDTPDGRQAHGAYLTAKARLAEAERDYSRSFDCLRDAADLYRQAGEISADLSKTLGLLGRIAAKREDWDTAVDTTRRALEISRSLKDEGSAGIHTFMLGWFSELRENWPEALRYYEESLPLQKNERGLRIVYGSIARAALEIGDLEKARRRVEESLVIANKDGCLAWNPHAYVSILRTVGNVLWRRGEWERALGYFSAGLDVARATGDDEAKNFILFPLIDAAQSIGATTSARVFAEEALRVSRKLSYRRWETKLQKMLTENLPAAGTAPRSEILPKLKAIENALAAPPPTRESLLPVSL